MRFCRVGSLTAVCVATALALGACGDDDEDESASGSTAGGGTAAETAEGGIAESTIEIGLEYSGGEAGEADSSLEPISVGFVTMKGGTPSFPEQEAAGDATVEFINEHLGGIDGHPVTLEKCFIQAEEDGQRCGAELLGKDVPIVHQALSIIGNASLYRTINREVPVLVGTTSTGEDSASAGVYSFTGGGPAVIFAMAKDTENLGANSTALVSVGNAGGRFTMEEIAVPALDQLGVEHGKTVYYDDDATTPDIVSATQAAGGQSADVIFVDPSGPQHCVSQYDANRQLGIDEPVVTTPICNAPVFVDETGAGPEGWRIWGFGENPRIEGNPEVDAYNNIMEAYGQADYRFVGFAPSTVRDLLAIAKFGNELGADSITPDSLEEAILDFEGPAFMAPGPQSCDDPLDPATQSICGREAVGSVFENGEWKSLGSITNEITSAG